MDIQEFMPLVRIVALKIHRPLPPNILLEDLIQDGMIGLIMAFREHDADSDIPFGPFAHHKIQWAILDGLRAGDWAERSVRRQANRVARTIDHLQAHLLRPPTHKEVADALNIRIEDVATILGNAHGVNFVEVDAEEAAGQREIPDSSMEPSTIVDRRMAHSRAVAGLKTLLPNERRAFVLRALCDFSGREAAAEMGLSVSRVSQLYHAANAKLADFVTQPPKPAH